MIALLLVSVLSLPPAQKTIQASTPHYTVDVLDVGSTDSGARLLITRTDTTRYHIVTLNRALDRVTAVRIRKDEGRVIALTDRGFAVIDPRGQAARDEVYGYGATAAESGRWVTYTRVLRDGEYDVGDGIIMYDTMRSPDDNHAAFPIAAERSSAAGWPVYPPANEWKKSSGVGGSHSLSVLLQWWNQPMYVAALRTPTGDRLVLADVSQPGMRVCTKALPAQPSRWKGGRSSEELLDVKLGRLPDGGYSVEIRSEPRGSQPETFVFAADCRS